MNVVNNNLVKYVVTGCIDCIVYILETKKLKSYSFLFNGICNFMDALKYPF